MMQHDPWVIIQWSKLKTQLLITSTTLGVAAILGLSGAFVYSLGLAAGVKAGFQPGVEAGVETERLHRKMMSDSMAKIGFDDWCKLVKGIDDGQIRNDAMELCFDLLAYPIPEKINE